jgi:hypothetical protein
MGSKFFELYKRNPAGRVWWTPGEVSVLLSEAKRHELAPWNEIYPLMPVQQASLDDFSLLLASEDDVSEALLNGFHKAVMELFLWEENESLLEEMACPVQRFLICASIDKRWEGVHTCQGDRTFDCQVDLWHQGLCLYGTDDEISGKKGQNWRQ